MEITEEDKENAKRVFAEAIESDKNFFEKNKVFLENISSLKNDTDKIENILIYLKSINNVLAAGVDNKFALIEMSAGHAEGIQNIIKTLNTIARNLDERIKKLED